MKGIGVYVYYYILRRFEPIDMANWSRETPKEPEGLGGSRR
jgi:hypothetical protein